MKVLIVCSYKESLPHNMAPFIWEQAEALSKLGVEIQYYLVKGRGAKGYLKEVSGLKKAIKDYQPNIVHAHFGLCGLLANLQRRVPVITTYHGCDIQALGANLFMSKISMLLSKYNIFVSEKMKDISKYRKSNCKVIPCGIILEDFSFFEKGEAIDKLKWNKSIVNIQFAGAFNSSVKNYSLAKEALSHINNYEVKELSGLTREEVNLALCAADCLLLTSIREGSPMIIKEAMACGCPIVSTDVGDVKKTVKGVSASYVVDENTPEKIAKAIESAICYNGRTNGREKLLELGLGSTSIANKIINIYNKVLYERTN